MMPLLFFALLSLPAVQNFLAHKATNFLSEELGTKVSVGKISFSIFLDVVLSDVKVNDQKDNTLLSVEKLKISFNRVSLKRRFASASSVVVRKPILNVCKYPGDTVMNYQFLIDFFSKDSEEITEEASPWIFSVKDFALEKAAFSYVSGEVIKGPGNLDFNNIMITGLDLDVRDLVMDADTIMFNIRHFSLYENQGFELQRMKGVFSIAPDHIIISAFEMHLNNSFIHLDSELRFQGYDAFSNIFEDVSFKAQIYDSRFEYNLLTRFLDVETSLNDFIYIRGKTSGKLSNLRLRDFEIDAGEVMHYRGSASIVGLPNFKETFMHFNITEMYSSVSAIENLDLRDKEGKVILEVSELMKRIGEVYVSGSFTGFHNDFVADARMVSPIGTVRTDVSLKTNLQTRKVSYKGKFDVNRLDLGGITGDYERFGELSMKADISGIGMDKDAEFDVVARIDVVDLMNYRYEKIDVDGRFVQNVFNGRFDINDPNIDLSFNGIIDINEERPSLDFTAEIRHSSLSNLNLVKRDSLTSFSGFINMQLRDTDSEKLFGNIKMSGATYTEGSTFVYIDTLSAEVGWDEKGERMISLNSPIVDAYLKGNYRINELPSILALLAHNYLPVKFDMPEQTPQVSRDLAFRIITKDTDSLFGVFVPELRLSEQTEVHGKIILNKREISISGHSPHILFRDIEFNNWQLEINGNDGPLSIENLFSDIYLSETSTIENFRLSTTLHADSLLYNAVWMNEDSKLRNSGDINGLMRFSDAMTSISVASGKMYINDSLWTFNDNNRIRIDSTGYLVTNLQLSSSNKHIVFDGSVLKKSPSTLKVIFRNFNLSEFDPLYARKKFDIDGVVTGTLQLKDLYTAPHFLSDISVQGLGFNHEELGDAIIRSVWDHQQRAAKLDFDIVHVGTEGIRKPLNVTGMIYPYDSEQNFDLKMKLTNFKVKAIEPYLASFSSHFDGLATGEMALSGSFTKPALSGSVRLMRTMLKIDYLNTTYSLADEIHFTPNSIFFNDVTLFDNNRNDLPNATALVGAMIKHENFKNFQFDINIRPNNFTLLNTNAAMSDLYYGRALATGNIRIHGDQKNVQIDVKARTERGTVLHIPLYSPDEISTRSFITFVQYDEAGEAFVPISQIEQAKLAGISLFFELEATPDAEVQIILDEKIGDIIRTRGRGNITMTIDSKGEFEMYGDYTVVGGDYLFTLQNVINKRFRIDEGGVIRWSGSPYDAELDLNAVYQTKAPLYDLIARYTDAEIYRKRQTVECHIGLKGRLMNPEIVFDIQVPGADENTREYLRSALYMSNNEVNQLEMNKQFLGLLVLGRFFPPEEGIGSAIVSQSSEGTATNSAELLSNQLSNWLSQISKDFDIGVNYRLGDELTNEEIEVALSTMIWDDRLIIDGNIGVGGTSTMNNPTGVQQQNTSNIVGDVNIEYRISPRFRLKAFNRSNQYDYLRQNAPYTQGVGVFFRKEFDSWGDLYRKKPDKSKPAE